MRDKAITKTTIAQHIREIMRELEIEETDSNADTPFRIANMYVEELFQNVNDPTGIILEQQMKCFATNNSHMVIMRDIEFHSTCEHHWLPFSGKMTIGYVPNDTVIGLSKIPRVVKYFSKKPQLQEKLVKEIADFLFHTVNPQAVFVLAEATHSCVACRGVESNSSTETYHHKGILSEKFEAEFFTRAYGRR